MGGGLMQLVAYGAQDIYLTGNPQITFFKVVYRRHTNFSMEAIQQTFSGSIAAGGRVTATISRNGDLVHRMWMEMDITPNDVSVMNSGMGTAGQKCQLGYCALGNVTLEIGGQQIDKQSGEWMQIWDELTNPQYQAMVKNHDGGATSADFDETGLIYVPNAYQTMIGGFTHFTAAEYALKVPLHFWFCRNPGLALPLIALQYHEVKVIVDIRAAANMNGLVTTTIGDMQLWCDYIYLDTDERRRFAQVSHEYLIEQIQVQTEVGGGADTNKDFTLNFNHPVKELIWAASATATPTEFLKLHFPGTASTNSTATLRGSAQLKLNGHDRFAARDGAYFTRCQPTQHHTNTPICARIGVYSFALKPEEHQPSGTCNFSRIDTAVLSLRTTDSTAVNLQIYAVNYNVLRIMSGMGGLAYSN